MEEKQLQQQPLQEVSQPQRRAWQPAGRRLEWDGALRAAAAVRTGGLTLARPADVQALGTLVGNCALGDLLAAAKPPIAVQPFSYRQPSRALEPAPVRTAPPALCEPAACPMQDAGLEPYPAAALVGGGDWT